MKRSETKSLLQPISSITIKRKTVIIARWVRQWIISEQQPKQLLPVLNKKSPYTRPGTAKVVPSRGVCHKAKGNRTIEINYNLNRLKQQADELLLSEEGIRHRKQRPCDVEAVFGNIKNNHHFKRFMLRGIEKVSIETGLVALAHNLRKKAAYKGKREADKS